MFFLLTAGDRLATAPAGELFDLMMAYSGRYRMEWDRIIPVAEVLVRVQHVSAPIQGALQIVRFFSPFQNEY